MFASTSRAIVASASSLRVHVARLIERQTFATSAAAASAAAAAAVSPLELTRLERPTMTEFSEFRAKNPSVPFLVSGALDGLGWKLSEWSPKDLRDRFGDVEVPLEVRVCTILFFRAYCVSPRRWSIF